jgi:hypothetical protein
LSSFDAYSKQGTKVTTQAGRCFVAERLRAPDDFGARGRAH